MDISGRAKKIKLLILDVDGVMTDGRVYYDDFGDELKAFDIQDGYGLTLWWKAGLKSAIITAKKSRIVSHRAKVCHIEKAFMGALDKGAVYEKALKIFKVADEEVCFVGDDLIDMPVMKRAGLAVAVPYSRPELKSIAHYTTLAEGGRGAIRELIEIILKAQSKWQC